MAKQRDYAAEYARRTQLAQQRGFSGYRQQRRYTEAIGTRANYIRRVDPTEIAQVIPRKYDLYDYTGGDLQLDAFMRYARAKHFDEEEAYDRYKRRAKGGSLSKDSTKHLEEEIWPDEDEYWYEDD